MERSLFRTLALTMFAVATTGDTVMAASPDTPQHDDAAAVASRRFIAEARQALIDRDLPGDAYTAALMTRSASAADGAVTLPSPADLLGRAEAQSPGDPLVALLRLTSLCLPHASACDARPVIQALIDADPKNAYPWTLALVDARRRSDSAGAAKALSNAARAEVFDDYLWRIDHRVLSALGSLPPLPVERDPAASTALLSGQELDADGVRTMMGLGITLAAVSPPFGGISEACRPPSDPPIDPATAADCLALAAKMMDRRGTTISWQIGYGVARRLIAEGAGKVALESANRRMRYLLETTAELSETLTTAPAEMRAYSRRRLESEGEILFAESELRHAGLPTDPPADWVPNQGKWINPPLESTAPGRGAK